MKKRIIGITIIVIAIVICGITYFKHQENVKQENITKQVNELENIKTDFSNTEERDEKFDILKSTVQKQEKYNKSKEKDNKVLAKYKEIILAMQLEFVDEYNEIIKENTISDIGKSEDIENLNKCKNNLNILLSNINKEKEFIFSEESGAEKYEKRINELVNLYSKQIIKIKVGQKAQKEAIKKQESQNTVSKSSSTTTENKFFTVTVPKSWGSDWNVKVEDNSMNGIESKLYMFDHGHGGAAVYVLDMSDTSRPLAHYSRMIPDDCESVGTTSDGYEVFMTEAADGFFSQGAKITLK